MTNRHTHNVHKINIMCSFLMTLLIWCHCAHAHSQKRERKNTHFDVFLALLPYYVVIWKVPNMQRCWDSILCIFFDVEKMEGKKSTLAMAIMQTKIYSFKDIYMKIHYSIAHLIYDYCAECTFRFISRWIWVIDNSGSGGSSSWINIRFVSSFA